MKHNFFFFVSIFTIWCVFTNLSLYAQSSKKIEIICEDSTVLLKLKKSGIKLHYKSEKEFTEKQNAILSYFHQKNYITATIDSVAKHQNGCQVYLFLGKVYQWGDISYNDSTAKILNTSNIDLPQKVNQTDIDNFYEKIIVFLEDRGYPFAQVYFQDFKFKDNIINAHLQIDKNQYILFDSLVIKGHAKITPYFLKGYLGLHKKKPYCESKFLKIPKLIEELPYVTQFQESGLVFYEDKADLYVYLNKRNTNQFDGYLGLVPVDENTGKVSVAGELNIKLQNMFKIGETIDLKWKAPETKSQNLYLNLTFPYLFGTSLGLDGLFSLEKKDTSYITMNYKIGALFSFLGNNYIKVYYNHSTSNVLLKDAYDALINRQISDYKNSFYGLDFMYRNLDFIYNPRKGYSLQINTGLGVRHIVKNTNIDQSYYDTVTFKTLSYKIAGNFAVYIPIKRFFAVTASLNGAAIFSPKIYANELYQIGGMNSLKGFDEESISASAYTIFNTEFRFIYSKFSYLNLFFNAAWYERKIENEYINDIPYGFGLGIAFDTKVGIFAISYALGSQFQNPISFKSGKIHLGMNLLF